MSAASERGLLLNLAGVDPMSPDGDKALRAIDYALARKELPPAFITQTLIEGAIKFRVIGGKWEASTLRIMHRYDISVLETAGERFMAAQALNSGIAARGGEGEAGVAAVIDGGAALERWERGACDRVFNDLFARTIRAVKPRAAGA